MRRVVEGEKGEGLGTGPAAVQRARVILEMSAD